MRALSRRSSSKTLACVLSAVLVTFSGSLVAAPGVDLFQKVYLVSDELSWHAASPMSVPRAYAEAVALEDGDVIVLGGLSGTWPTATTEIYDSQTGTWAPGPDMLYPRVGHTATLLEDGTILVTGGETGQGTTSSAEIVDPEAGSSSAVSNMYFSRSGHEAVLLPNGRVLVTGGTDWISEPRKEAEAYDPGAHEFVPAGSMSSGRVLFSLVLTNDGKALAAGGDTSGTSESYDPSSNTWSGVAAMTSKRYSSASALAQDGKVVVAGGVLDSKPLTTTEYYSPADHAWSSGPAMLTPRANFGLAVMQDGALLATGSYSSAGVEDSTELLRADDDDWEPGPDMLTARGAHVCATLPDGTLLVAGGLTPSGVTASCELLKEGEPEEPDECQPKDIIPLVESIADELPGHSEHGFVAQLLAAQAQYDIGDIAECLQIMNAFYYHVRGFLYSEHMSEESARMLYDAYAHVVECLGGDPLPEYKVPGKRGRTGRPV